jgi:DUF4097 and DUF4098 domain-containing protein YvlB
MTRSARFIARLGLITILLAASGATTGQAAAQSPQEETFDRTVSVQPGSTVRIRTFSGRVRIRGTDGTAVVIHAVRRASADRLRDIQIEVTQSGNQLEITANHRRAGREHDNVVETDFDIQVPARTTLDVNAFSAPIEVTNVQGPHRLKTFSADISLDAQSWNDADGIDADSFSGDVRLRLPDSARGVIAFDSFSGRFESDLPVTLRSSNRRNFRGDLNGGGLATFRFKTFSGSAEIRR